MALLKERIELEIGNLVKEGHELLESLSKNESDMFLSSYDAWYTRSLAVVRELLPDRIKDFNRLYHIESRKDVGLSTYTISNFLDGINPGTYAVYNIVGLRFYQQIAILESAKLRIDDILSNIRELLQAELLDGEIEASKELLKSNHLRAAGTVAGVSLERHFSIVCLSKGIKLDNKHPQISDYNDKLKEEGIIDVPTWRFVQRLGDIRNYCCHHKDREPTKDEVDELIRGVDKIIKTIH